MITAYGNDDLYRVPSGIGIVITSAWQDAKSCILSVRLWNVRQISTCEATAAPKITLRDEYRRDPVQCKLSSAIDIFKFYKKRNFCQPPRIGAPAIIL